MQNANSLSGLSSLDTRTIPLRTIKFYRYLRTTGTTASFLLFLLTTLMAFPFAPKSSNIAEAAPAPVESETTIAMVVDKSSANLNLTPKDPTGSFASSSIDESASFNITTNNYTGYTLSISGSSDDGQLTSDATGTSFNSIDSVISETTFDNTVYNGKWGYVPSKYNSTENTSFRPAPTTSASTLDVTERANSESNNYTIGLGARADIATKAGTYTNTFILTAVGNPVPYSITYADDTGDSTVANLPSFGGDSTNHVQTGSVSASSVILSGTIPTRNGYTFLNWCLGATSNNGTICTGTTYTSGGEFAIDRTTSTKATLNAVWSPNITIKTSTGISTTTLNGTSTSSTSGTTVTGLINGQSYTLTTTTSTGYSFSSWPSISGTSGTITNSSTSGSTTTATYTVGSVPVTITPTATANMRDITIKTSTGVSKVKLNGVECDSSDGCVVSNLISGQSYNLEAELAYGYEFVSWDAGENGTIASPTSSQTTYTIGSGNSTIVPTTKLAEHNITIYFNGSGIKNVQLCSSITGRPTGSGITYACNNSQGTISVSGGSISLPYVHIYYLFPTFLDGYEFSSWQGSSNVSFIGSGAMPAFSTTDDQDVTLTLTAKLSCQSFGSTTMQAFDPNKLCSGQGTSGTLTDSRDNQSYMVAKLADGKWWMLDNLRLGVTDISTNLTSSNTNTNLFTTITAADWNSYRKTSGFTSYTAPMFSSASANNTTTSYGSGSGKIGVYYNYCAASAGTYCMAEGSGSGNASYDICPKGWRMPTGNSSGEYQALYTAYSSNYTNFRNALSTPLSGYFYGSSARDQGSYGSFWSSTYDGGYGMYSLNVYSSGVNPTDGGDRSYGYSVRCLLK